jgi:hypothetical protein
VDPRVAMPRRRKKNNLNIILKKKETCCIEVNIVSTDRVKNLEG